MNGYRVRLVTILALMGALLVGTVGCSPQVAEKSVEPGRVWEASASGLPVFYLFSDPS
jgi:hypothetical protein